MKKQIVKDILIMGDSVYAEEVVLFVTKLSLVLAQGQK